MFNEWNTLICTTSPIYLIHLLFAWFHCHIDLYACERVRGSNTSFKRVFPFTKDGLDCEHEKIHDLGGMKPHSVTEFPQVNFVAYGNYFVSIGSYNLSTRANTHTHAHSNSNKYQCTNGVFACHLSMFCGVRIAIDNLCRLSEMIYYLIHIT